MKPTVALRYAFCVILVATLAACSSPAAPTPTLTVASLPTLTPTLPPVMPTATWTEPPVQATATTSSPLVVIPMAGTSAPPIVFTSVPTTEPPTPEPTLKTTNFPDAQIQIHYPADLSQLVSPFTLNADLLPGFGNKATVRLFGEDGRTLCEKEVKLVQSETGWVNLNIEIDFEIPSAGETALLVLTTKDEFGRVIAQSTSKVFLMQIGRNDMNTNTFFKMPYMLQTPKEDSKTSGGTLHVRGYIHAYNLNPLIIDLQDESGEMVNSMTLTIPESALKTDFTPFFADIAYDVSETTPVRLSLRQNSDLLPDIDVAITSRTILLHP